MKDLVARLREVELGALRDATPADLFDLEAALTFTLVEVRRARLVLGKNTERRTDGVQKEVSHG